MIEGESHSLPPGQKTVVQEIEELKLLNAKLQGKVEALKEVIQEHNSTVKETLDRCAQKISSSHLPTHSPRSV